MSPLPDSAIRYAALYADADISMLLRAALLIHDVATPLCCCFDDAITSAIYGFERAYAMLAPLMPLPVIIALIEADADACFYYY